jgi:hypothetical protein
MKATCLIATIVLLVDAGLASAQGIQAKAPAAAYDIVELPVSVGALPDNPYDPDQIDITGEFMSPSGKKVVAPAFFRVDQETIVTPARERLRDMRLLKLYMGRDSWIGGKHIEYIIDDVRLVKYDGTQVVIGDFEKDDPRWKGSGVQARIDGEIVHSGKGALRADFPPEAQPNWPGLVMDLTGQSWSDVKELRFFFYPLTDHTMGTLSAEFYAGADDKFQTRYSFSKTGLKMNAWNEIVWDLSKIGDRKQVRAKGPGGFFVRYCPKEPGVHRYVVRRKGVDAPLAQGEVKVAASRRPGFLRIAGPGARYVTRESGKPVVLIGENVCWPSQAGLGDYDAWLTHLAAAGGNYVRVWMAPWAFGIEWDQLGRYQQDRAADLDYVLALARKLGINVMLCLDYHGFLRANEGSFGASPYAASRGGPCQKPTDFLTSEAAKAQYKKRLRYIVARYAAYDNLLSWELWNEVDIIEGYNSDLVTALHQEMARYIRSVDPYAHIITTSTASSYGDPKLWSLPEIDYVQSHTYSGVDKGAEAVELAKAHTTRFNKPFLIGEFGINGGDGTRLQDPEGLYIHDGAWGGILGGCMGTAMTWWWDSYIEPGNLYHLWTPVAKFSADITASARPFPADALSAAYATPQSQVTFDDLPLEGHKGSWEEATYNTPQTFTVGRDGTIGNFDNLATVLHGVRNHPKLHNPATFEVDFAKPGRFVARVYGVSGYGGAKLKISVDGQPVFDRDFDAGSVKSGEIHDYDRSYPVDVPAGKHTIKVENDGNDWVYIDYLLVGYAERTTPNYLAAGLVDGKRAWLWLHNRQSVWYRKARVGLDPTPIPASRLSLKGMPDGAYTVEWWDTWTGKVASRAKGAAKGGVLRVDAPGFERDVACKVTAG